MSPHLFDPDTTLDVFRNLTRDNVSMTDEQFFSGFDIEQVLAATIRRDPRFLQANSFQTARSIRIGVKFSF